MIYLLLYYQKLLQTQLNIYHIYFYFFQQTHLNNLYIYRKELALFHVQFLVLLKSSCNICPTSQPSFLHISCAISSPQSLSLHITPANVLGNVFGNFSCEAELALLYFSCSFLIVFFFVFLLVADKQRGNKYAYGKKWRAAAAAAAGKSLPSFH